MNTFKITIRLILVLILFIPWYVFSVLAYSIFGIVPIVGFIIGLSGILAVFTDNYDWRDDVVEAWSMVFIPFVAPIVDMYKYVRYGKLGSC